MKYAYTAVFTPEEGGYNVNFPDLQGCYTCGDDMADAIYMAQDEQFTSVITADTEAYRRFCEERAVKKTLTLPGWLNERAERAGINFSGILQEALKERLHIYE